MKKDVLLKMDGISKRFGATRALKDVSFEISAGNAIALIGENGAGKSTLMKVLSGAHQPGSGKMSLAGEEYQPDSPNDAREIGVAMIYQELNLAPDLSIEDNIMLGQEIGKYGFLNRSVQRKKVHEALRNLGHPELKPTAMVRDLSVAVQQLVEIARALVFNARVVVFDEPTSSLTQKDVQNLFRVIRNLKEDGIAIIYISHFLEEIKEVCDSYTVLRDGESVGSGDLKETTEEEIVALMVGRSVEELFPQVPHTAGDVVLKIENLSASVIPKNVKLNLHSGEILGISGLVGAGRTELLRCLYGLDPVRSGQVKIGELNLSFSPKNSIHSGMGLVSENRKEEGLAQTCSITDNMTYSKLSPYSRWGWLNLRKRKTVVAGWMKTMQVKAHSQNQSVSDLSGGNQQKVAIARVLHQDADILLLDEPTRGIDVGTKAEIYRLMGELAANGKAIIFVSSYLTELLAVCDRIAVMSRGQIQEVKPASEWTEESIMTQAIAGEIE